MGPYLLLASWMAAICFGMFLDARKRLEFPSLRWFLAVIPNVVLFILVTADKVIYDMMQSSLTLLGVMLLAGASAVIGVMVGLRSRATA